MLPRSPRAHPLRALAVGLVVGACALGAAFSAFRQRTTAAALATMQAPALGDLPADWCAPGFEAVPGGGCLAIPSTPRAAARLVVYLHGRYARTSPGEEIDRARRLAARATSRGFAVLALRGRLGECSDPALADWYCWPSNERNAHHADAVVGGWTQALAASAERTGARRPFLLGFSNGGYFAGLLATRGLLDVEALVVAHGGPVEPVRARGRTPPLLLLSADDDVAQDEMIRYDEELARERWPHDSYARSGSHGLTDEDIDAALTFFSRASEPLPLRPPLPLHRPTHHARDAAVPAESVPEAPSMAEAEAGAPDRRTDDDADVEPAD
jgi:dienelactone hydrolase